MTKTEYPPDIIYICHQDDIDGLCIVPEECSKYQSGRCCQGFAKQCDAVKYRLIKKRNKAAKEK